MDAQADNEQDHSHLDRHYRRIESRTLLDADHQNRGDDQCDQKGRQVKADLHSKNRWCIEKPVGLLN